MSLLTEYRSEKYGRKLIGRTDMEDALKRLDKLTQEEARMAVAQNLKATHAVDKRVTGVANMAVAIDNRVAGVDDRVAGVDDRVARVDDRVARVDDGIARVDDKVARVDDKVAEVLQGAQTVFSQAGDLFNLNLSDGKEAKQVMRQTANDVDLAKCSSSHEHSVAETDCILQATNSNEKFNTGSPPLTRQQITTLFGKRDILGLERGSSRAMH
jgi:hypothetical protein